jgi:lipoate-protein ligase A
MTLVRRLAATDGLFDHVAPTLDVLRRGTGDIRVLRFSTPLPTMAFSRRDQLSPYFPAASAAVEAAGFRAEVRPVGGTFAPMHPGSLVIEEFGRSFVLESSAERFVRHTGMVAGVLRDLGVDARIGEIAGEYCPGRYSINASGRTKVSGTAQRVSGTAWLVSTVVQLSDAGAMRAVTARCGQIMRAEIDLATIGSVEEELGSVDPYDVARRVAAAYRSDGLLGPSSVLNSMVAAGRR